MKTCGTVGQPEMSDSSWRMRGSGRMLTAVTGAPAALRLFEALVEEHAKGAEFALKQPSGETVAYKIFL